MSHKYFDEELSEHKAKMKAVRQRQEADQKAMVEKHEAAMQPLKEAVKSMEYNHAIEMNALIKRDEEEISAAMQAFETNVVARRLYDEAPDDVFELLVMLLSDVDKYGIWGKGGLNVLRLVSKRCLQVVESVATRLTSRRDVELPVASLKRCKRIEHIRCGTLDSLEGCPDGLKSLRIYGGNPGSLESLEPLSACKGLETLAIDYATEIKDLSPLSSCLGLKMLILNISKVSDLSPLSSLKQLELLSLWNELDNQNITTLDISPISQCKMLKSINFGNQFIEDFSPLSQLPDLDYLDISCEANIEDLSSFEKGFANLRLLNIKMLQVGDLSPLSKLQNLEELDCRGIPSTTSLLPLARCLKLKKVSGAKETGDWCEDDGEDLAALLERRPELKIFDCCGMQWRV